MKLRAYLLLTGLDPGTAGAADPHVETSVTEKLAQVGPGADYLAEAVVRSTATGRPLAGHAGVSVKGIPMDGHIG